jgi:hypothetical protein
MLMQGIGVYFLKAGICQAIEEFLTAKAHRTKVRRRIRARESEFLFFFFAFCAFAVSLFLKIPVSSRKF